MGFTPISHTLFLLRYLRLCSCSLFALGISLRSYWHATGGGAIRLSDLRAAFASAAQMKNLKAGMVMAVILRQKMPLHLGADGSITSHYTGFFCALRPLHRPRCCTTSLIFRPLMAPLACQSCWASQVALLFALGHWVWAT